MQKYQLTLTGISPLLMHWDNIEWADLLEEQRKASEATAEIMAKEISNSIEEGVARGMERGIAKGHLKINDPSR